MMGGVEPTRCPSHNNIEWLKFGMYDCICMLYYYLGGKTLQFAVVYPVRPENLITPTVQEICYSYTIKSAKVHYYATAQPHVVGL